MRNHGVTEDTEFGLKCADDEWLGGPTEIGRVAKPQDDIIMCGQLPKNVICNGTGTDRAPYACATRPTIQSGHPVILHFRAAQPIGWVPQAQDAGPVRVQR
ncbi:MAG: hypothetical protein Fues2KO_41670 [Fuerstiella sp.]